MARCARQGVCPLLTVTAMAPAVALWRAWYCDNRPDRCERLRLVRLGQQPPPNLLPNGKLLELSR